MKKNEIILITIENNNKPVMEPSLLKDFDKYFDLVDNVVFEKEVNKQYTGLIKILYADGQHLACWNYKEGKLDGEQLLFYKNGNRRSAFHFKDNVAEGEQYNYYENGNRLNLYTYKGGSIDGNTIFYYENGQKKGEGYSTGKVLQERKSGHWIYYHENGNKKEEGEYSPGGRDGIGSLKTGTWKYYDEQGNLIKTEEYDDWGRPKQ